MHLTEKIGFGGGCHWCTEAYFQCLKGVAKVEQGWISSIAPNDSFSEAVIVHYDPAVISLKVLTAIHLHTHACTKMHRFRKKYRSAVYVFDGEIAESRKNILECQPDFTEPIITEVLPFDEFRLNTEQQQDYYKKNKNGVFCQRYISPKLQLIEREYSRYFEEI